MNKIEFVFNQDNKNKVVGVKVNGKLYPSKEISIIDQKSIYEFLETVAKQELELKKLLKEQRKMIEEKQQSKSELAKAKAKAKKNPNSKKAAIEAQENERKKSLPFEIVYDDCDTRKPAQIIIKDKYAKQTVDSYFKEKDESYYEFIKRVAKDYPQVIDSKGIDLESLRSGPSKVFSKIKNFKITKLGKNWLKNRKKALIGTGIAIGTIVTLGHMIAMIPKPDVEYEDADNNKEIETNIDDNEDRYNKVSGAHQGIQANEQTDFKIEHDDSIFEESRTTVIGSDAPEIIMNETKPETQEQPSVVSSPEEDSVVVQPEVQTPQPTNPQPTNPQPTNPQPTNPQPTNPQPTNPQPTNPQPTNPQPTNPQSTNPQPTNPQPTDPVVTPEPTPTPETPSVTDPGDSDIQEPSYEELQQYENSYSQVYSISSDFIKAYYSQNMELPALESVKQLINSQYGTQFDDAVEKAYANARLQYEFSPIQVGNVSTSR